MTYDKEGNNTSIKFFKFPKNKKVSKISNKGCWRHRGIEAPWCSSYLYSKTSVSKASTQVLRTIKSCSWRVGDRNGEDLLQWFRLKLRLNALGRSTIPQKQFIIIMAIIIIRLLLSDFF